MVKSFRSCLIVEARTNARIEENKPILQIDEDTRRLKREFICYFTFLNSILVVPSLFVDSCIPDSSNVHFDCNKILPFSCFEKFCVHGVLTLIYVVETFIMFILMVIFMTYNVYFCTSVLLGVGLGYFIFGSSRVYAGHH